MIQGWCERARLWMQAPSELNEMDSHLLTEHLAECPMCRSFQAQMAHTDRLLWGYLEQVEPGSVRHRVRSRLASRTASPGTSVGRWLRALPVALPVALIVAALALGLPQLLSSGIKSTPARAAWRLVRPDVGYPLAVDPNRRGHLLAGAWGQVYESWTGGRSWHALGPLPGGLVIRALSFDAARPHHYLVATKHSIFLSTDAGRSWEAVASDLPGAFNVFLLQDTRNGNLYVGPSVLWKSTDHGRSWRRAGENVFAPYGIQGLAPAPGGKLATAIWDGGVALSNDDGRTWRRLRGMDPHVLDVAAPSDGGLWAATRSGLYASHDEGRTWAREQTVPSFLATTLLSAGGVLLVGGDGGLYASYDRGRTWNAAMDGLPLDPWIFELAADVHHPGRLYASLDGDGLFRSDDYGRHWAAIDTGLPLHGQEGSRRFVLFTRQGYLWITDTEGTDPGVLTVEHNVQLAALSPDGAAAAYLTENKDGWAVRVLGAGGSAARTAALGHAPMPVGLLWAPSSAMLAVVSRDAVAVAGVGAQRGAWRLRSGQRVVGWSADGRGVLVWQSPSGAVTLLSWRDGQLLARIGVYPGPPVFSRDGKAVAVATRGRLWIGRVGAGMRRLRVAGTPALEGWSEDGSTLLVRNGSRVEMLDDEGRLIAQTALAGRVGWLPGSDRRLLTGAGGSLRVWSSQGMHTIVNDARPIESMRGPVSP